MWKNVSNEFEICCEKINKLEKFYDEGKRGYNGERLKITEKDVLSKYFIKKNEKI